MTKARILANIVSTGSVLADGSVAATGITGAVPIASGGTGATTRQDAINALAGTLTAGHYLRGHDNGVAMSGILAADVPTLNQNTTGSAATLTTPRTISITGDVAYTSGAFDGSTDATGVATLSNSGVTAGTYGSDTNIPQLAVDSKGRVTSVTNVAVSIPSGALTFTGDVTGTGSTGATTALTLTATGTAGTYTKVTTDSKGRVTSGTTLAAGDIPALDASKITTGTIDAARLPSYVDDVVEAANLAGFPATGETGKIYVALDTNKAYRWSGSAYIYITSGAVDSVAGRTGVVTLTSSDVGLGSVENKSSATIRGEITSTNVTSALGFTPYNSTNPSGYITSSASISGNAATATNSTTTSQRIFSGDISTAGQGRFTGWYTGNAATGQAVEVGISSGEGYLIVYDRGASTYGALNIQSTGASLRVGGNQVNVVSGALQQGGNQVLHAGNYNTYALPLTGGTLTGAIDASGTSGSVGGYFGTIKVGYGAAYGTIERTDGDLYLQYNNNYNVYTGYGGGFLYAYNSVRSPLYYDSDDTAYYVDPNNTSRFSRLNLGTATTSGGAALNIQSTGSTSGPFTAKTLNYSTVFSVLPWAGGGTYISSGIYYDNGSWIHQSEDTTNCLFLLTGAGVNWYSSNNSSGSWNLAGGVSLWNSAGRWINDVTASTDVRAPIFYDSNDTGYYVDPNGTSVLSSAYIHRNFIRRENSTSSGISWYSPSYTAWAEYMSPAGATGSGPTGNITAPSGTLVNSWALRSFIENASGYGWTFESGSATGQPSVVAEIRSSDGSAQFNGSVRSPVYYDSNDTGYFIDPNSTSDSALRMRGGALFGPNTSWGAYLYVGGNGRVGTSASVAVTNGNLHLDSQNGYQTYINWYNNENIYTSGYLGLGSSSASHRLHVHGTGYATSDFRAPIFYDSDDTGYYLDPNGTSRLNYLRPNRISVVGSQDNGEPRWDFKAYVVESQHHYGQNSSQTMYIGEANYIYIRSIGEASESFRAPIYYDSNNTAYYLDPNTTGTSLNVAGSIVAGGNVTAYSDEKLKTSWTSLPNNYVEQLADLLSGTFTRTDTGQRQAGVGAQSLQKFLPEVVAGDTTLSVAYGNAAMVSAVALAKRVVAQDARIITQDARIAHLELLVAQLLAK